MGVSTDAILVYGIALKEGARDDEAFSTAFDSIDSYGAVGPVELVMHCCDTYTLHILARTGTELRASRGNPRVITALDAPADAAEVLERFVEEHALYGAIDAEVNGGKPGWLLCSDWR